jgi:hypothetical protein
MLKEIALLLGVLTTVHGLGQQRCLYFPDSHSTSDSRTDQVVFGTGHDSNHEFIVASSDKGSASLPILTSSKDNIAVHLAVASFVTDVEKVTGSKLKVYNDTLPGHSKKAVIVGTSGSQIVKGLRGYQGVVDDLEGKWESFDIRVLDEPTQDLEEAMVISGSDRVSCRTLPYTKLIHFREVPCSHYMTYASNWASRHGITGPILHLPNTLPSPSIPPGIAPTASHPSSTEVSSSMMNFPSSGIGPGSDSIFPVLNRHSRLGCMRKYSSLFLG